MTKNLYVLLILFLGLTVACSLVNSVANLMLGPEIFMLENYIAWFAIANVTIIIGSVLLLKYYHYRNYRPAFFTGLTALITNIGMAVIVIIILATGQVRDYYAPALLFSICIGTIYGAVLVFSKTRERFWLRMAGACFLVIGAILVSDLMAITYTHNGQGNIIYKKIGQWGSMALGLAPGLYIVNFVKEIKIFKTKNISTAKQEISETVLGFAGVIVFLSVATLGVLLLSDCFSNLYWKKHAAEEVQRLTKLAGGASTFVDSKKDSLHYLLVKPAGYDPKKIYPLVVCLPFGGYVCPQAELLSSDTYRRKYPAFLFVPYCADGTGWGGIPHVIDRDQLVYETLTALAYPGIDVKRRYVTGVSRGGYGAWQFICTRPDLFAAAMPVCGGGNPKLAAKVTNMAIWAFHGAKDRNVPVSGSRDMIAAIKKAGGHPKYTEFPNDAHNIWEDVKTTPGVLDWLFAQKRE